jgi:hypothetical protein
VAVLVRGPESDEFVRLDYAEEAWKGGSRPGREWMVLGSWRGTVPEPGARRKLLVDDQSLLELFEGSGEDPSLIDGEGGGGAEQGAVDPETAARREKDRLAFRFVLALILLRKRLLIGEGQKGKAMLVRPKGVPKPPEGPELIEVVDPGLDDETVVRVTEGLGAVISGEAPGGQGPAGTKKEGGA